jgi:hypothetical protein
MNINYYPVQTHLIGSELNSLDLIEPFSLINNEFSYLTDLNLNDLSNDCKINNDLYNLNNLNNKNNNLQPSFTSSNESESSLDFSFFNEIESLSSDVLSVSDGQCEAGRGSSVICENKNEFNSKFCLMENLTGVKSGKVNKKESNKKAAVRYRAKKSKEREKLFAECDLYEKQNSEMKKKIENVENEISFIRSLLIEALLKKNKI